MSTFYMRGFVVGLSGFGPAPPFPGGDATWSERLYARAWSDGVDRRLAAQHDYHADSDPLREAGAVA